MRWSAARWQRCPCTGKDADAALMRGNIQGTPAFLVEDGWYRIIDLLQNAPWVSEVLIAPCFGRFAGYAFEMLGYFVMTNLVLAVFNLIPLPPLDGYHVLNDLLMKRNLFASPKAQTVCSMILYAGVFTGVLSTVLEKIYTFVLSAMGSGVLALLTSMGLF
jgi:Zn-dependent proteases